MVSRAGSKIRKPTARELKDSKLPCPSPSNSDNVVDNIVKNDTRQRCAQSESYSAVTSTREVHRGLQLPTMELQASAYIQRFPKEEQSVALLGLLTRDAADRAFQANVFDGDDLEATFAQLRELLDTPLHPVEYQTQFHAMRQDMGETTEAYAYRVRQLVAKAFPGDTSEGQERSAMERFVEGVANHSVKNRLITKPQESFNETVLLVRVTEKLQRAVQKPDAQCWAISQQQPPQRTNPWAWRPYRQPVAGRPYS
ncbi:unnamed protein product [Echinostoma caproni]|uniref:Retrotrans_gag domain-containing protein n=1 Tax=Echinostoma caproni TaxID=27848 RepID=A0A183BBR2_9TREM|nr:unnamed protein product [Echinostoma caproni]